MCVDVCEDFGSILDKLLQRAMWRKKSVLARKRFKYLSHIATAFAANLKRSDECVGVEGVETILAQFGQ